MIAHPPALLLALFALAPVRHPVQSTLDDGQIRAALEERLLHDAWVPSNGIDIHTEGGLVTLQGVVPHVLAKERATSLSELVRGVRAVTNHLRVRPARTIPPTELVADMRSALRADPATEAYELSVRAGAEGVVELTGTVDSWGERELAEMVVKGVRGVTALDSRVLIEPSSQRSDAELEADIRGLLRWNAYIDHDLIEVRAVQGTVQLSGVVASAAEKTRARIYAYRAGAARLEDDLEVAHWSRDASFRGSKYEAVLDREAQAAIARALRLDPRIDATRIELSVAEGVATLSGIVPSLRDRRAADQDAAETVGVRRVRNHLKVRPKTIADVELTTAVAAALRRDPVVDILEIQVLARRGVVFLDGVVNTHIERASAEEASTRVRGVTDVVNALAVRHETHLEVEPSTELRSLSTRSLYAHPLRRSTQFRDEVIEANIEDLLRWSVYVNANRIGVSVEGGIATLEGDVGTLGEQGIARRIAITGGAQQVRNRLDVEPMLSEAHFVR